MTMRRRDVFATVQFTTPHCALENAGSANDDKRGMIDRVDRSGGECNEGTRTIGRRNSVAVTRSED